MKGIHRPENKGGMDGLIAAVRELGKIKRQARALGIFTDDRELLECPKCGLMEDVTFEGLLVTYKKDNKKQKDTGLRFRKVNGDTFKCPKCGIMIKDAI